MGIDRQRIVDNFYPAGSEVASHFTPCAIPNGCDGEAWYEFDRRKPPRRCWPKPASRMASRPRLAYRDVVRGYLPQPGVVAQDIQAQLKENLNIDADDQRDGIGRFHRRGFDAGKLTGLHLLGWGADYPDMTNFLDYHFGAGASDPVRRQVRRHHRER